jgi:Ser/Thr protein kinase RdoA (MazF antagonist)
MHLLQHTPGFSPEQALAIAREHYGLEGPLLSALPSERDQNFLLERCSGERFVLKIANALEDPGFLEAQHLTAAHQRDCAAPGSWAGGGR